MQTLLAPYAVSDSSSRGRQYPEAPHPYRSAFERDRDRVIHSTAFRRLEGKTQVFTTGINDHYRTRMTHTIEVSQIGRTIARVLNLNESLTEAVCLAHDLGHSPFGHVGETALNELTSDAGGFEHNRQSLRIVEFLEHPYPDFAGLNLMQETRTAIAKHHSPYDQPDGGDDRICLEGQIADIADRIAYNCHDLEDGLRANILNESDLDPIELYRQAASAVNAKMIDDKDIRRTRIAKAMLDFLARNAIETSRTLIDKAGIDTLDAVYRHPRPLIALSPDVDRQLGRLEHFLMNHFYLHPQIKSASDKVRPRLTNLFVRYVSNPEQMPAYYCKLIPSQGIKRAVCDYIAGMTDRYCLQLLKKGI